MIEGAPFWFSFCVVWVFFWSLSLFGLSSFFMYIWDEKMFPLQSELLNSTNIERFGFKFWLKLKLGRIEHNVQTINNRSFLDINYYNSIHMSIKQISVELLLRLQRPIKSAWKTKFRWYFTLQNDLLRKSNFLTHTSAYGTFVTPCIIKSDEHKYLMWRTNNSWLTQKWIDLRHEIKIP